ncbi:MAG: triacylglycerol lipase [Pseudomonadota bacterium]|jgi:triacylglycerol lipase|nr:triacylglycerol lipase [Pseudomonadota bacterium]MEC8102331.1 triacylglycerol lipase [Pseudomonadota bacterium]MEE2749716.1 triacylglycerol lipase [Pseudomonadota bacterium]
MKKYLLMASAIFAFSADTHAMSETMTTGYTETKYPIVLVHGFLGFEQLVGVDYWYKIPETLQQDGAEVFIATVSNTNYPEVRGEQLIEQIEEVLAITGAEKVNLIGHSHGGPTTRYAGSVRPDIVASVSSISGVNKGTVVADTLMEWSDNSEVFGDAFEVFISGISQFISFASGSDLPLAPVESVRSMTTEASVVFNAAHPGGIPDSECGEGDYEYNGVRYYSWAGAKPLTNILDPLEPITIAFSQFFPEGVANDGFVDPCTSNLGMVIRNDFAMTHLDEVNQMLGLHAINETDPLTVFRTHANRLKNAGL